MKKFIIILSTLFALLIVVILVAPIIFGILTKKNIEAYAKNEGVYDMKTFKSGWFSSSVKSGISSAEGEDDGVTLVNKISHGPIAWSEGVKPCLAFTTTTLDRPKMTDESKAMIEGVYEGEEPVIIKTKTKFNGTNVSKVTLTEANGKHDDIEVRFEGGEGEFSYDEEMTFIKGDMQITPITINIKNEDEPGSIQIGEIDICLLYTSPSPRDRQKSRMPSSA